MLNFLTNVLKTVSKEYNNKNNIIFLGMQPEEWMVNFEVSLIKAPKASRERFRSSRHWARLLKSQFALTSLELLISYSTSLWLVNYIIQSKVFSTKIFKSIKMFSLASCILFYRGIFLQS